MFLFNAYVTASRKKREEEGEVEEGDQEQPPLDGVTGETPEEKNPE